MPAVRGAELIRHWLDAFNRRDSEAMIALQHPEIEFVPITGMLEGRTYRTPDETREFIRSLELDWECFVCNPETFYEEGDQALALGTWTARGRGSGVELNDHPGAWLITVRDGLVYRWRTHTDVAEALSDMGVSEAELPALLIDQR